VAGLYYFRSVSRIQGTYYHETSSSETNFGWMIDTGFTVTRFRRPHRPRGMEIDFGVSFSTVRNATETEGIDEIKFKTDANEVIVHVGVIWHRH